MKPDRETTAARAVLLWQNLDKNERHGVRFGLFPFQKMQLAEAEGFDGRALCLELLDLAKA
jgi:hypothetical protein